MRISTSTIYAAGLQSIQNQTVELLRVEQQMATGRRVLSPEDDPIAASSVLDLIQYQGVNNQYKINADNAKSALEMEETALSSITELIQNVKVLAVSAGTPSMSQSNLASIATEVVASYQQLLGYANQKDGQGQYLFSGYKGATQPFQQLSGAGVFSGDQGQRKIQISPSRQIETSDHGAAVFKPGVAGQDLFKSLDDFATALTSGTFSVTNLNAALNGMSSALDNVLKIRASVGSRLREIDAAQSADEELNLHFEQAISSLRDVDYAKAATELTQRQLYLEAAQKSFMKVSGLSLFNYI